MNRRIDAKHRTVSAMLIAVFLLSLPGTGLLGLGMMLDGLAAAGGGLRTSSSDGTTVFMVGSVLAFVASAAALCWRGVAALGSRCSVQWPNAEPGARPISAPTYDWTCHVCGLSNPAGRIACTACGAAPSLSMAEVAAAKAQLERTAVPAGQHSEQHD